MGDISKLPKWAQDTIRRLQYDIKVLKESLDKVPHSQVQWGSEQHGPYGFIPDDRAVRFYLDKNQPHRWVECKLDGEGGIEIYGNTQLMIHLNSGNHMHLNTGEKGVY